MNDDADTSSESLALRPRARILRTLGEELISSETVAVIELVKNAYDADARGVLLRFTGEVDEDREVLPAGEGVIEVIDNGHGMAMDVVRSAWMEPATDSKRKTPYSEELERRVLGEKGIGRFAASRLASELELVTRRAGAPKEIYALFDWTQFDDETRYLDEVLILAEQREPEDIIDGGLTSLDWAPAGGAGAASAPRGTVLRMNGLKRAWGAEEFSDLQRDLARLVSPFANFQDFSIRLEVPEHFGEYSREVESPSVIRYPHYVVSGQVEEDGSGRVAIRLETRGQAQDLSGRFLRPIEGGDMEFIAEGAEAEDEGQEPTCGPFRFELRVWDRDELGNIVQETGGTIRSVRKDLDAVAGINIYRDGFRVLPYGEPRNDWLRLDMRRVQNPTLRLSNNQIAGYVTISADTNPLLRDQSNREGLDENRAMADLRGVMLCILAQLEPRRYDSRDHRKPGTPGSAGERGLFDGIGLDALREHVAAAQPEDTATRDLVTKAEEAFAARIRQFQTVLARYHSLATLGQLIDVVLHEGRQPVATITNEVTLAGDDLGDAIGGPCAELAQGMAARFSLIGQQAGILAAVFNRIEPFGGRKRGRPAQLYLERIIDDAFGIYATELDRHGVEVVLPETRTLVRVDQAEIEQVFVNLLNNSLHWLKQVKREDRQIAVSVERKGPEELDIVFADNGPGIPCQHRASIFEPYFSLKPNGVGLGLTITGEIVTDFYGGTLELLDTQPLRGAAFRITLRKRV